MRRAVSWLVPYLFGTSLGWQLIRLSRPILTIAFKDTKLTCLGKTDGGGSQVLSIVGVAAFAEYFGAEFVHTPLSSVEHCPRDEQMQDFCVRWETIVALFGLEKSIGGEFTHYELNDFLVDFLLFKTRGKRISLGNIHYITDTHPEVYNSIRVGATGYQSTNSDTKSIYVHVRRGDVKLEGPNGFRHTSDENVRRNIEAVREQVVGKSEVYIVTENPDSEFNKKFEDCTIVSEKDPVKVLFLLAKADVLIMAKSAFSYVAALASRGKIFYEPYWQGPISSWSILPPDPESISEIYRS